MSALRLERISVFVGEIPSALKLTILKLDILGPRVYPYTTPLFPVL